jgi:hypothetical protein
VSHHTTATSSAATRTGCGLPIRVSRFYSYLASYSFLQSPVLVSLHSLSPLTISQTVSAPALAVAGQDFFSQVTSRIGRS